MKTNKVSAQTIIENWIDKNNYFNEGNMEIGHTL